MTANNASRAYGAANPPLTGTIVGLQPGDNISATYSTAAVADSPVGTYQIVPVLNDPDNKLGNVYAATTNFGVLTVTQAVLTVTADAKSKVYGNTDPALTYQITSGSLVSGDSLTGALTRVSGENVGSYAIQQGSLAASANYALTFIGANLSIGTRSLTTTADAKSKVYGNTDPALTYQITSGSLVSGDSLTGALTRVSGENVGSYAIQQGSLAASANYALTFIGANLSIGTRSLTTTADAKSKVYGNTDPALTYQITSGSLVSGDSLTGALTRVSGENVGSYAIQQGSLAATANYALTFIGANLSIGTRGLTTTADAKSKVYGDTDPALTYQITSGSLVSGDSLTGALTRVPGETVGTYAIQQGSLAASANYALTFVGANLSIGTRSLTTTADAKSKAYGDTDPALTYQITSGSLVSGDSLTGALTRVPGETVGTYAIQQGSLAASANYALTYAGANLTISPRAITVTADDCSKLYGANLMLDGTAFMLSGGLFNGDTLTNVTLTSAGTPPAAPVGSYPIVPSGAKGIGLANYNLAYLPGTLTVTQGLTMAMAGTVAYYPTNYPPAGLAANRVGNVTMSLTGDTNLSVVTLADGSYGLSNISVGGTYCVTPSKTDDSPTANGVDVLDLIAVARHITGGPLLDSPYKLLAADVNADESIDVMDLLAIQKLIVEPASGLPAGLWRFVPADYAFPNPQAPWDAPTNRWYTNLVADVTNGDFVAIKLGDVDNSWTAPSGAGGSQARREKVPAKSAQGPQAPAKNAVPEVVFAVSQQSAQPGQTVAARVTVSGFSQVSGAQFTLAWDPAVLRYVGTGSYGARGLSGACFGTTLTESGKLTFAWYDPEAGGVTLADGTVLFTVEF